MEASQYVKIIRREVKHARLRVREDASVELVVPMGFGPSEIEGILQKKGSWIQRQQEFFRSHPRRPAKLASGGILLFGRTFRVISEPNLGRQVVVDRVQHVVRSGDGRVDISDRNSWYRVFARDYLTKRVVELSEKHRLAYGRLFVRSQRTRWGSCSGKRNISLNWRLITAPPDVIDYVILHELVHTRVMDHSQRFWVNLAAICPGYKSALAWLQSNTPDVQT
jgi:predicted metal-dependent hydrolase